jgi:acetate kinase
MNILVFNVGSTTLKFACIDTLSGQRLTHGTIDRIGQHGGDAPDHLSAADMAWSRHALCGDVDMRAILSRRDEGDQAAALAIDIYVYRLQKYIGAYFAILGGLDALVFTAGIGENAATIRQLVTQPLSHLGIQIDPQRNNAPRSGSDVIDLTATGAMVRTLVIPTDEELAIAMQVAAILHRSAEGNDHHSR